jgi:hypothetical protein
MSENGKKNMKLMQTEVALLRIYVQMHEPFQSTKGFLCFWHRTRANIHMSPSCYFILTFLFVLLIIHTHFLACYYSITFINVMTPAVFCAFDHRDIYTVNFPAIFYFDLQISLYIYFVYSTYNRQESFYVFNTVFCLEFHLIIFRSPEL